MLAQIQAKLVLVERGVHHMPVLAHAGEQTVLVLGPDESLDGFQQRVRNCTELLRHRKRSLSDVTYVVGNNGQASWLMRRSLLSDLCGEVAPEGSVAVLAPTGAADDVLRCLGDLQATLGRRCALRAVFTDATRAPQASASFGN